MKAVSLKQPFVGWIATGEKTLVKRTWRTSHWGPLHIMSSLKPGALGTTALNRGMVFLEAKRKKANQRG